MGYDSPNRHMGDLLIKINKQIFIIMPQFKSPMGYVNYSSYLLLSS